MSVTARTACAASLAAAGALFLAGCQGAQESPRPSPAATAVPQGDVEDGVRQELEGNGYTVDEVECLGPLPAEPEATLTCDVSVEGQSFTKVDLRVTEIVDGEVRYSITPKA